MGGGKFGGGFKNIRIFNNGVGNPVDTSGFGNTGRTKAYNLTEQMVMHEVQSDPLHNAKELKITLKDPRWKKEDGWVKMQRTVETSDGKKYIVHFLYNKETGEFDDFKFK